MTDYSLSGFDMAIMGLATATLAVTVLGIIVAIAAVVGARSIKVSAIKRSEQAAKNAIDEMLNNKNFNQAIEDVVAQKIEKSAHEVYNDLCMTSAESIEVKGKGNIL
ncbi:MAG: hypothetical protein R8M45_12210 [Ghiorsea sp.]